MFDGISYPIPSFITLEQICVITCDGRLIVGELVGHDQVQNLVLHNAQERVYSNTSADNNAAADGGGDVELVDLGLYVVRGDNVCLVADFSMEELDKPHPTAQPIPPIQQHML
jgi:U6 snRNA-associated Sm-like protein LSm8